MPLGYNLPMKGITPLVASHILRLFAEADREAAGHLMREDLGAALPGAESASIASIERVQCAALKLSGGRMDKLYDAIALAQTDWRDFLVAAGFANDPRAHKDWRN